MLVHAKKPLLFLNAEIIKKKMLHLYVVQLLVACDGNRLEESTIDF